jgi:hypothetical protein
MYLGALLPLDIRLYLGMANDTFASCPCSIDFSSIQPLKNEVHLPYGDSHSCDVVDHYADSEFVLAMLI